MVENVQKPKSIVDRLRDLEAESKKRGSMVPFNAVVVNVGIPAVEHYPKLKDAQGNDVLDENGRAKYGDVSDGYSYWFAVFGKRQLVNVISKNELNNLSPLKTFRLTGFGWDIRQSNAFYIKEDGKITKW